MAQVQLPDGGSYQRGRKKQSDAIAQLKVMLADVQDGVMPNRGSITVSQWLDHWLTEIAKPRLKPSTFNTYRSIIKVHLTPALGSKKLEKVSPADVRAMCTRIAKSHSTRTAQATFNVLSKALKDAVRDGSLRYNVCDRLDRPKVLSRVRQPLTADQARTVLTYLGVRDDYAATARWSMSLLTGARQAECLGLTWDRVDFDNRTIDISWSLARLRLAPGPRPTTLLYPKSAFDVPPTFDFVPVWRAACLVAPKTAGSRRVVPMIAPLEAALRAHRATSEGQGLVWVGGNGGDVLSRDDTLAWRQLMVASGVADDIESAPELHVARHTVASLLQEAGVEEATRMALLGHTTVTAHRDYAHVNTDLTRAALGTLGTMLKLD